jgi:hypothetical protein
MQRSFLPGMLALLAGACVSKSGRIESNRFQHQRYPYAVFFDEPVDPAAPFGKLWRVDNLTESTRETTLKGGDDYTFNRVYDLDADGRGDFERLEQRYDLLLEHASDNAAMWITTFPLAERALPAASGDTSQLATLATRYAAAMAAQGELSPAFGPDSSEAPAGSAQASIERTRACSLSEREALRADLGFASGGEQRSASIVVVRTGYQETVTDGVSSADRYPVFMIVGVMARPEQRPALEGEYQRLLDHTVLGDKHMGLSMHGVNTCGSQAPQPPNSGAETPGSGAETPGSGAETPGGAESPTGSPAPAASDSGNPEDMLAPMPPEETPTPR